MHPCELLTELLALMFMAGHGHGHEKKNHLCFVLFFQFKIKWFDGIPHDEFLFKVRARGMKGEMLGSPPRMHFTNPSTHSENVIEHI